MTRARCPRARQGFRNAGSYVRHDPATLLGMPQDGIQASEWILISSAVTLQI